ncbi:MAG: hypothetical protein OXE87_00425 [Chloroflexi bacterium]|nr:hypothetical protein [Chloroflexota bacterium]
MSESSESTVSMDDFRVLVRLAGLPLDDEELGELLPLYQFLRDRVDMLHEADLPLGGQAMTFPADWSR